MSEIWEETFKDNQEIWGFSPVKSARLVKDFFIEHQVKNILIPGIGYGRNAVPFLENDIAVTGIEISQTAIGLAGKHFGNNLKIYHGSVTEMPFDDVLYDGIFCHGLIYLLNKAERKKLIRNCANQLKEGGFMVFTVITKEAQTYGQGKLISKDRYEQFGGIKIFFYDRESIEKEFAGAGLFEITDITENFPFHVIKCRKNKG